MREYTQGRFINLRKSVQYRQLSLAPLTAQLLPYSYMHRRKANPKWWASILPVNYGIGLTTFSTEGTDGISTTVAFDPAAEKLLRTLRLDNF